MLLGIKWYQFVRNDDVLRQTKQPKLIAVIQLCRLTLFGHIMDNNADADSVSPPSSGLEKTTFSSHITWLSTVQQDLKYLHLTLPELAQNSWLCG